MVQCTTDMCCCQHTSERTYVGTPAPTRCMHGICCSASTRLSVLQVVPQITIVHPACAKSSCSAYPMLHSSTATKKAVRCTTNLLPARYPTSMLCAQHSCSLVAELLPLLPHMHTAAAVTSATAAVQATRSKPFAKPQLDVTRLQGPPTSQGLPCTADAASTSTAPSSHAKRLLLRRRCCSSHMPLLRRRQLPQTAACCRKPQGCA